LKEAAIPGQSSDDQSTPETVLSARLLVPPLIRSIKDKRGIESAAKVDERRAACMRQHPSFREVVER
jgi:hypothetical protein